MGKLSWFYILLLSAVSYSQTDSTSIGKKRNQHTGIDTFAKSVKYTTSFERLSHDLTARYDNDLDKVRSIFIWITENIAYDYKFVNKKKKIKPPKYKKGCDRGEVYKEWEDRLLKKVIRRKKGVCDGYSRLFQRLCAEAGIQCSIITGYSKQMPKQVGKLGSRDHAWNAILIDGQYYFLDVTWASGYCLREKNGKLGEFVKDYDNFYWLTPADKFHRNHFPIDKDWMERAIYTKEQYRDNAWVNPEILADMEFLSPDTGVLKANAGDTIHFRVKYSGPLDEIEITTNLYDINDFAEDRLADEMSGGAKYLDMREKKYKRHYVTFQKKEDDIYEFYYVPDSQSIRHIDVYFNYNHAMRFKIKAAEK